MMALDGRTQLFALLDATGDIVSFADLSAGVSGYDTRLDYAARTDAQPVYIGRAPAGTLTSATNWTVERLTYDVSDRPTLKQVRVGAWDDRAALNW